MFNLSAYTALKDRAVPKILHRLHNFLRETLAMEFRSQRHDEQQLLTMYPTYMSTDRTESVLVNDEDSF